MTEEGEDPHYKKVPTDMDDWHDNNPDGEKRWQSFVGHFNLKDTDGGPAPYQGKAIYFLPSCEETELAGKTGGSNFGILAKIPVLVQ
jgi:hypothetical protein